MQLKTFVTFASCAVATIAQSTSRIAFTALPTSVTAGQPVTLQWGGGDGTAVTITLQQGTTTNLQTVQIITGSATGTSYTWTPSTSLPNAQNYALRIQQGDSDPNYTGMITLTGGSSSSNTNAVSVLSSASASASATGTSSSASVPINPASGGIVAGSGSSSNFTTPITIPLSGTNATTTAPVGSSPVGTGASAVGTGTTLSRNTTLSKATLSSTTSSSSSSSAATTTTSSSGTSTSGGTAPSSSSKSGAVVVAGNVVMVLGAVAGVIYLL
ncbi:hypothetical protein MMC28_000116 [Mycoblastus sanguinarius]|nr:hypothetical protein [Mycoblastus sanguinarius]